MMGRWLVGVSHQTAVWLWLCAQKNFAILLPWCVTLIIVPLTNNWHSEDGRIFRKLVSKRKLFEPGSSTRDSGGEAICPHGWHSALGTPISTILFSWEPLLLGTHLFYSLPWGHTPLLCSGEPLLFSTLGHFFYSLLCYPPLLFSALLCHPALLCSVSLLPLCPGHNCHQGPILSRAVCSTGQLKREKVRGENSLFRRRGNTTTVCQWKPILFTAPTNPPTFVNCLTDYKNFNIYSPGSEDLFNSSNRSHFFTVAYFSHTKQML